MTALMHLNVADLEAALAKENIGRKGKITLTPEQSETVKLLTGIDAASVEVLVCGNEGEHLVLLAPVAAW